MGSFGISEGNKTRREKKKKKNTTEYVPNCNYQHRSSPDTHVCHQQAGAEQGRAGCMLRVRTKSECPEGNLRELTRDGNPNCRIARERGEKKRERERTLPQKALT